MIKIIIIIITTTIISNNNYITASYLSDDELSAGKSCGQRAVRMNLCTFKSDGSYNNDDGNDHDHDNYDDHDHDDPLRWCINV